MMHYNEYLFISLLKLFDSKFNNLEYDTQYKLGLMQYKDFEESRFNVFDKTEYECITDYLSSLYLNSDYNRTIKIIDLYDKKEISLRVFNCLKYGNIHTLGELENKEICELFILRNFGKFCLRECEELLKNYNLKSLYK